MPSNEESARVTEIKQVASVMWKYLDAAQMVEFALQGDKGQKLYILAATGRVAILLQLALAEIRDTGILTETASEDFAVGPQKDTPPYVS